MRYLLLKLGFEAEGGFYPKSLQPAFSARAVLAAAAG
jgi:hypothetical protein